MFPIFGLYNLPRYLLLKGAAEEAMKIWSEQFLRKLFIGNQVTGISTKFLKKNMSYIKPTVVMGEKFKKTRNEL